MKIMEKVKKIFVLFHKQSLKAGSRKKKKKKKKGM